MLKASTKKDNSEKCLESFKKNPGKISKSSNYIFQSVHDIFHKHQVLRDPTTAILLVIIYGAYAALGFYAMTYYTSLVFAVFFGIICYPLFVRNNSNPKKKNHTRGFSLHPAIMLFFLMPFSFAVVLLLFPDEQNNKETFLPLQMLVVYNYSIALLFLLILVPMALLNKSNSNAHFLSSSQSGYCPSLSIIVPAHNEEKVIERTIKSVLQNNYPKKELIIINNASTDNTSKLLKKYANKIQIVNEYQKGKAIAINSGIRVSHGQIIVVMDADTIVTKDAFRNIVQPFYKNPKMGAVTGNVKILNYNDNYHTKIQVLEYALASQISKAALASQEAVTIVSGAFGAFRKSVIDLCCPFSNDTLTEDLDATITVLKNGYTTTIQETAVAYTEAPTSLTDLIKQRTRWYRGLFQGYAKHPELLTKVAFGHMPGLIYFLMFNASLVVPLIGFANLAVVIYLLIAGSTTLAIQFILLNAVAMSGLFVLSLRLNKDKLQCMKLFPLAFVYLRIHDFIFVKAMLEHVFKRKAKWNHLKRIGDEIQQSKNRND
ncbi:MAG: glycosyltransferase family 2 protein [Nitrosopumilus sp.]